MGERVTMKEVGEAAGVSVFTVSMALRGSERVAAATRERVEEAARRLGYERDAAAAMLVGRRGRGGRERMRVGLLAMQGPEDVRLLRDEARRAGYEAVDLGRPPVGKLKHVLSVEWHRGMQGVILSLRGGRERAYVEEAMAKGVGFGAFSVVAIGPGPFSCVRDSAWQGMSETLARVVSYGYRRIGVLLGQTDQKADDDARLAAVLLANERLGERVEIVWHLFPASAGPGEMQETKDWIGKQKPEALVVFPGGMIAALLSMGFRSPEDFAVAGVPIPEDRYFDRFAGVFLDEQKFRTSAIELLDQQLRLGIRGLPANPIDRVLHLVWRDGASLPRRR